MKALSRITMTAGLAGMIAVSALVPALAHAATVPVSGRITAVAVDPTPPPAPKTLTSRDTSGGGSAELHTSCGPNSSHPFTPCDEEFIRFCTILGGNSDIQEPSPGDLGGDEPSGTCDVPGPEAPHPQHD
jgi:hypothetical protein